MAERRQGIYFVSDLAEIEQGINTHNNDWRLLWVDEIIDGLNERFRALSTTCSYLTPAVVLRLVRIKTGESRPCLIGWGGVPQSFQRNGRVEKRLLYEPVQRCRILEISGSEVLSNARASRRSRAFEANGLLTTVNPRRLRYMIVNTAVVLVFPSRNGWICHNPETKSKYLLGTAEKRWGNAEDGCISTF